jgi:mannose-6-phosphate isomerase
VHPDDEYADKHEGGKLGKTEMWYVLHAEKGAELIYGFSHDISKDTLREDIATGTLGKYLQRVKVRRGDVFFMPSGTVHGIGAGIVLAEIQESSNLTYRLYDYDRVDRNGNKRELHIEKALDVAILKGSARPRQPMRVLKYRPGWAQELLIRCKYFQVDRVLLNTECVRNMVEVRNPETSFEALLCLSGCCTLITGTGEPIYIIKGDCVFVPARSVAMRFHGKAQFLRISC